MNEENSYESDISEGWSLIDINLNEESMNTSETQSSTENEKRLQSDPLNLKSKEAGSLQSISPSRDKLKNEVESTFSNLNNSSSDDSSPNQEILTNFKEVLTEGMECAVSEPVNDSCDAESIEILDVDGNYRDSDIDNLDATVIDKQDFDGSDHSSNKESLCDEYNIHNFSGIRRKRRKLSRDSESSADNFKSEIAFSDGRYSYKTSVMQIENCRQHVYRHYRNHVANTVLNLLMRVIFAGVACIAIGHFLGVHDGEGTAGELYDTLKKVQMENIALQSRLSQLNRAVFTREVASKWESTLNKLPCDKNSNLDSEKTGNGHTSQPEHIQPEFNSAEWLSKVEKLLQKGCENKEKVDITKITDYIQDVLTFLRNDKKEDNKIQDLEETNAKISKLLQKMVVKLSSSQENLENLYSKFLKLKDRFNRKVSRFFPDLVERDSCHSQGSTGFNSKAEKNLNAMEWNPVGKTTQSTILSDNPKPKPETTVSLCIFPQSEEYYLEKSENSFNQKNSSSSIVDEEVTDEGNKKEKGIPEKEDVILEIEEETVKDEDRKSEGMGEIKSKKEDNQMTKKQEEKKVRGGKRKKDLNERDSKAKQSKHNVYKSKTEKVKRDEKTSKRKFDNSDSKEKHSKRTNRGSVGEEKGHTKKHTKTKRQVVRQEVKVGKRKRKSLDMPKEFWTRKGKEEVWLEPEQFFGSHFHSKEGFDTEDRIIDGKLVNFTGDWFFRLSKGRDEFRRQEILSDWQFERAKARMGWRNGDKINTNWQFQRAVAREDGRMEKLSSNNRK